MRLWLAETIRYTKRDPFDESAVRVVTVTPGWVDSAYFQGEIGEAVFELARVTGLLLDDEPHAPPSVVST